MIDSKRLLFALRSELDEQSYQLNLMALDAKTYSASQYAQQKGYVDALRWTIENVEARAKKVAA